MVNNVLRPIFQQTVGLLSGNHDEGKLLVLTYHRVLQEYDQIIDDLDAVQFTQQMETLAEYFNVLSLGEGLKQVRSGNISPGAVCITFDDGYRDNYDVALPILQALDLPATFFIATGYLGDGVMWNDIVIEAIRNTQMLELDLTEISLGKKSVSSMQNKCELVNQLIGMWRNKPLSERNELALTIKRIAQVEFKDRIMMTHDEVRALASAGMEIGGHTMNHPVLTSSHLDDARYDIEHGKEELEKIINKPVKYFAYPSGRFGKDYDKDHVDIVKQAGFTAAVSTNDGVVTRASQDFELPRVSIDHASKFKFFASLTRGYMQYQS